MSMQLRISHTTDYVYEGEAVTSYNEARLTPLTSPEQIVVHTRLEIAPTPWTYTYRDYFGTLVTAFEVLDPHDTLTVHAQATVHTDRTGLPSPTLAWSDLEEPRVSDTHTEYLVVTPLVAPPPEFAEAVQAIRGRARTPGDAAVDICTVVNEALEYLPGATQVHSVAAEAWDQRAGVCQDMTHLAIGGLRTIGIPARYVSGYFHPREDAEVGQTVEGESHAWVEWWDGGWHAFDVTNDQPIGDRHVVLASGRDYTDVRPLSGIFSGSPTSHLRVTVSVTRLA